MSLQEPLNLKPWDYHFDRRVSHHCRQSHSRMGISSKWLWWLIYCLFFRSSVSHKWMIRYESPLAAMSLQETLTSLLNIVLLSTGNKAITAVIRHQIVNANWGHQQNKKEILFLMVKLSINGAKGPWWMLANHMSIDLSSLQIIMAK